MTSQDKQVQGDLKYYGKSYDGSVTKVQWDTMPETSSRIKESWEAGQQVQRQKHRGTFFSKTNGKRPNYIYLFTDSKENIQAKHINIMTCIIKKIFKVKYFVEEGLYMK